MDCPKCKNVMNDLNEFSFNAAKCTGCHGIWFRDSSHKIAKKLSNAAAIDNSDTNSSSAYNLIRDIDCPECDTAMIKMIDPTQLTIELESCADCYGVFFDAGEFTDFSEFTLLERVKGVIDTFRINLNS